MDAGGAARLRRDMLAFRDLPEATFFVIATPLHVFLWKNAGTEPEVVEPHSMLCSEKLFARHFARVNHDARTIPGYLFRVIVSNWLILMDDPDGEGARIARENGSGELVEAMRRGMVREREVA